MEEKKIKWGDTPPPPEFYECKFFNYGTCKFGDNCRFIHDPKKRKVAIQRKGSPPKPILTCIVCGERGTWLIIDRFMKDNKQIIINEPICPTCHLM
jgi:hypothetical protein